MVNGIPMASAENFDFPRIVRVSSHLCENHHLVNLVGIGSGAYYPPFWYVTSYGAIEVNGRQFLVV